MSKITNDDLTLSGTGYFIAVPNGNSGRQRVNTGYSASSSRSTSLQFSPQYRTTAAMYSMRANSVVTSTITELTCNFNGMERE